MREETGFPHPKVPKDPAVDLTAYLKQDDCLRIPLNLLEYLPPNTPTKEPHQKQITNKKNHEKALNTCCSHVNIC